MEDALIRPLDAVLSEQSQDLFFTFKSEGLPSAGLTVLNFSVQEEMSDLCKIDLSLISRRPDLDLSKLMGKGGTLAIHDRYQSEPRYFHGIVATVERGDRGDRFTSYQISLLPSLYRLRFASDCRIFQLKTVPEIAREVLTENGIQDFVFKLSERHQPREYLTQYNETHYQFLLRILAEEGIAWHFEHEKDKHILVLTDITRAAPDVEGSDAELEYNSTSGGITRGHYVGSFLWSETTVSSEFKQRDHFFRNPQHSYSTQQKVSNRGGGDSNSSLSMYNYPGRYKNDAVGEAFSRYRLDALRSGASAGRGIGRCQYLSAGRCFTLSRHFDAAMNRRYFLVSVLHEGGQSGGAEETAGSGGTFVNTEFVCIRDETPWRPDVLLKPFADGPQMGIVAGPEGEEIYCDDYGRVKVYFPWDRRGKQDDSASCWIRVASNWAGAMWGHMAIPRIGQNVIVDYLDGDFDQPIITGRSYNALNLPPYKLPDNKTRMTIKSQTHKGQGYNELRFEDENDQEEVFLHAQKYHNAVIESDETWQIGGNRHKRVNGSQSESIGGSKDIEVAGNHNEVVTGDMSIKVRSSRKMEIDGDDSSVVRGIKTQMVKGSLTQRAERDILTESNANQHYKATGTIYLDAGSDIVLQAGSVISLNVNGNFIRIDNSGISIEGKYVNVNTGGSAPQAGKKVSMIAPAKAEKYHGPHAKRYKRSSEK